MFPEESVIHSEIDKCDDCKQELELAVLRSNAGYYIGTECHCGPYSRESEYYPTREMADRELRLEVVLMREL